MLFVGCPSICLCEKITGHRPRRWRNRWRNRCRSRSSMEKFMEFCSINRNRCVCSIRTQDASLLLAFPSSPSNELSSNMKNCGTRIILPRSRCHAPPRESEKSSTCSMRTSPSRTGTFSSCMKTTQEKQLPFSYSLQYSASHCDKPLRHPLRVRSDRDAFCGMSINLSLRKNNRPQATSLAKSVRKSIVGPPGNQYGILFHQSKSMHLLHSHTTHRCSWPSPRSHPTRFQVI